MLSPEDTIVSFIIIYIYEHHYSFIGINTHPSNPLLLTLSQLVYVKLHVDEDYEYDGDGHVPLGMVRGELVKDEQEEEEKTSVSRELARTRAYRNTFFRAGGKSSKSKYYMGGTKTYISKSSKSKSSKSKSSKGSGRKKKKKGRNRKNRKRRYPWEN